MKNLLYAHNIAAMSNREDIITENEDNMNSGLYTEEFLKRVEGVMDQTFYHDPYRVQDINDDLLQMDEEVLLNPPVNDDRFYSSVPALTSSLRQLEGVEMTTPITYDIDTLSYTIIPPYLNVSYICGFFRYLLISKSILR